MYQSYPKLSSLTTGHKECHGCCIPGMWIANRGMIKSDFSICTNMPWRPLSKRRCFSYSMNYGQKYHFVIAQTEEGIFKIEKDGKVQEEVKNRNPKDYDNVKAYFSDPWQPGFVGCLSNLKVSK